MVLPFAARPKTKDPPYPEGHARRAATGPRGRAQLIISAMDEDGRASHSADLMLTIVSLPVSLLPTGGLRREA
jgi:hypothetical protein